mmetsp:Transcript_34348/g.68241  ORF Transcript_34348/g.68241 Transcript_34348/m.68241 type:complete len:211 (-) Transcript_34348:221-853(-)
MRIRRIPALCSESRPMWFKTPLCAASLEPAPSRNPLLSQAGGLLLLHRLPPLLPLLSTGGQGGGRGAPPRASLKDSAAERAWRRRVAARRAQRMKTLQCASPSPLLALEPLALPRPPSPPPPFFLLSGAVVLSGVGVCAQAAEAECARRARPRGLLQARAAPRTSSPTGARGEAGPRPGTEGSESPQAPARPLLDRRRPRQCRPSHSRTW